MISKVKKASILFLLLLLPVSITVHSCNEETIDDLINILSQIISQTGWLQDKEQLNNIPEDITPFEDETSNLKPSVSLESKFPPIGDQGKYGTCVAWSVGYNLKTSLNAIEKGWTSAQLADAANQTSPKDLWLGITEKGANCEGTNFEPAMDALIASGAASLNSVPYNMGSCTGSKTGNAGNKLANYRKIAANENGKKEGMTVDNFKGYLNAGRPISFGARLGDRFMSWKNSSTISSDTYNNPGMQHAYHAMVLVGYDDSKQAFRVRNSWGTSWGDNGSIWVDYDFFCNNFCFAAFVAQNVNSVSAGSGGISQGDQSKGYDLMAYDAEDSEIVPDPTSDCPDCNRVFSYDIYNSGNKTILPSQRWTVVYLLYNAMNANDYKVIYEDYYTDEHGSPGDFDYLDDSDALAGGFWNYFTVAAGKKAGEAEFPDGFEISYKMPTNITGKYYLVVMADSYDKIAEVNEDNNFYFITAANGKPLEFSNGKILNMPASTIKRSVAEKRPAQFSDTETQTLVKPGNLNTYTPTELKTMLIHDKKSGKLEIKRKAFRAENTPGKKYAKRAVK